MSSRETRSCPQCGSSMSYRLGEFDCPSCGHTELAAAPKEESSWGRSSDSVNRAKLISPPSAPPAPGSFNLGGISPEDMYGGGPGAGRQPAGRDSLHIEKLIFMGLQVLGALVLIVAVTSLGTMASAEMTELGLGGVIAGILIGTLINVVLYGLVLFSDAVWLKWTCLGCQTFALIGAFVAIFAPQAAANSMGGGSFGTMLNVFQFIFVLWFASIIYRDIMRHQEY